LTRADPLARAVFALLVVACFGAFILTQRLKHTPTAVQRFQLTPYFSPTSAGHVKEERISFKLDHADRVSVWIIRMDGDEVAQLARARAVPRYKQFKLRWNGRTAAGGRAPAGEYRVRVTLLGQRRTVYSPRNFTLVRR
jgi:hypothetical protein